MPDRRPVWVRFAAAVVLAAGSVAVILPAAAQTGAPKYYPGTIKPPSQPTSNTPPRTAHLSTAQTPVTSGSSIPKPKQFTPQQDGVRQASAFGSDLPPVPLPADLEAKPTIPSVSAERALPIAPPPQNLSLDRPKLTLDPPAGLVATPANPSIAAYGPRQTPAVSVECEMPESVGVGQPLVYFLVVKNTGQSAVSNVRVDHELPGGATLTGSEPAAESTADGRLSWSFANLDAATEKKIKVTVKAGEEGEVRGRATVSFATAVEGRVKVTRPKIAVAITAAESSRVGEKVVFNIKITNSGSGPASSMTLHAKLSEGLSHAAGNVIEAPLANLPAGQSKTLPLEVLGAKAGVQTCTLTVYADANQPETAKTTVTLVEPLLTAKQSGPAKCLVKSEPTYQIELNNPGTASTEPLTVWTLIPDGFEFVQATDSGSFTPTNRAVVWKLPALSAGANKVVSVKLKATSPTDGVIRTIAQSGAADQSLPGGVAQAAAKAKNLEAKCETAVKAEGVPALRFEVMDLDDPVEVGKEAVYEIKVTNQGTGACTNISIIAELHEGTTVGAVAGQTTGRSTGNSVVFDPLPQLPVKGEATFKLKVKGNAAGDTRIRVKLTCDQIKTPVTKEENTRFFKE